VVTDGRVYRKNGLASWLWTEVGDEGGKEALERSLTHIMADRCDVTQFFAKPCVCAELKAFMTFHIPPFLWSRLTFNHLSKNNAETLYTCKKNISRSEYSFNSSSWYLSLFLLHGWEVMVRLRWAHPINGLDQVHQIFLHCSHESDVTPSNNCYHYCSSTNRHSTRHSLLWRQHFDENKSDSCSSFITN